MEPSEIRVKVTREDIERAYDEIERLTPTETERICPVAQALIRLGYIGVEVHEGGLVDIGIDRFDCIDERPIGEQLSRYTEDFDASEDFEREVEPAEFVLHRLRGRS